jgi:DHA3 family macrolide efflux protein-like MFS transporter
MKNLRAIALLFTANTISGIAQGISMIAIPWHFSKTEDMTRFGIVYGISTIISLFWVPYSGTLVDKYNRKHIFQAITIVSGLFTLGMGIFGTLSGTLDWWMIALVFLFTFFNYNIHYPNLYAFMQEITEKKYYGKISSYLEVFGQLASALAGATAALLLSGMEKGQSDFLGLPLSSPIQIDAWPIHKIFLMDGITYVFAFILISMIQFTPLTVRPKEVMKLKERLQSGWNWLMDHKRVLQFGIASYLLFGTVMLVSFYLCASYVSLHLKLEGDIYATAEMFYSVGALLSGLFIRYIFRNRETARNIAILTFITGAFYCSLHFFQSVSLLFVSMLFLGISNAGVRILRVGFLFENIPNQYYGRVNAVFFLSNLLIRSFFIGIFALPFFLKEENFSFTYLIMAAVLAIATIWCLRLTPYIKMKGSVKRNVK